MADTPKRAYGPAQLAAAAATLYTVPGGTTFILRAIRIMNSSGTDRTVTLSIGADAAGTRIFNAMTVPGNGALDWAGFIPMAAAEIIQGWASAAANLTTVISGVEVT